MYITVKGTKNKKLNQQLKLATGFYAKHLFKRQMLPYLCFYIEASSKLKAGGYCSPLEPWKPREFQIELKLNRHGLTMLTALAHEMIHAKQFAYGELRDRYISKRMVQTWHGVPYADTFYWDQPWEIEAYGLEGGLVARFLQAYNQYKFFKTRQEHWQY